MMDADDNREMPDPFLAEWLAHADRLRRDGGEAAHASRVIPVGESLPAQQWVLAGDQALEFVRRARTVALIDCECRSHYGRCTNSVDVCIVLDRSAERHIAEGSGRPISADEAAAVLRQTEALGLVHLTIYTGEQQISAVCSCCTCCCHNLQVFRRYGRPEIVARADYVAVTDPAVCAHCGTCIERCAFGARLWEGTEMCYDPAACFGCGLCVSTCPAGATTLQRREPGA